MEENKQQQKRTDKPESRAVRQPRNLNFFILLFILISVIAYLLMFGFQGSQYSRISLSYFRNLIQGKDFDGKQILDVDGKPTGCLIGRIDLPSTTSNTAYGWFKTPLPKAEPVIDSDGNLQSAKTPMKSKFFVELPPISETRDKIIEELRDADVVIEQQPASDLAGWYYFLFIMFSLGLLTFMLISLRRSQNQFMGGGGFLSNFARSTAKQYEPSAQPITFKDVAGLEGVKADLNEIVEFLRDPTKFQKLGGRVPKGALLIGPPGTGKTLLARAIAGEAEVPFFTVNGSEFIQMFVGVGASRVRDLFATAKAQAPAIIFIDEIDAVGRQRGAGLGGGHDEREQTLNQILGEMDGFQPSESVIVIAATNRPDVLDPALLRPGRFDRHVTVSRPTKNGRLEIFKVHVRKVPLGADVDLDAMAQATAGMTGADIQNLVNEAALWAARNNKTKVEMEDFYYAQDKVLMGAKREEILSEKEKERTAYHESGHTLAAWFLPGASPVHKVTVIPRGRALGVTQMVAEEDRMNLTEHEIKDHLVMALAGRAAELLIYNELTVGAENDLERATAIARKMVTSWGMSQRLGPVSYKLSEEDPFLGGQMHKTRQFSEHTMEVIDEEVQEILQAAADRAIDLLKKHQAQLEAVTRALIQNEELDRHEIEALLGPSVHKTKDPDKEHATTTPPSDNGAASNRSEIPSVDNKAEV
jgi:cell division protease FtsH